MTQSVNTQTEGIHYGTDDKGKKFLIKGQSEILAMDWEKPYLEACVAALEVKGDVLEIGFNLGIAAEAIHKSRPNSHTIIEGHPALLEALQFWAQGKKGVTISEGQWEKQLRSQSKFDTIFLNRILPSELNEGYALDKEEELKDQIEECNELKEALAIQLKMFRDVKFADKDLEDFKQHLEKRDDFTKDDVIAFVHGLAKQGNISDEQKKNFLKSYDKQSQKLEPKATETLSMLDPAHPLAADFFYNFIVYCLENHMNVGSSISSWIDIESFEANKGLIYSALNERGDVLMKEEYIPVLIPAGCQYYHAEEAVVFVVSKVK
jgi:hypothetical protein